MSFLIHHTTLPSSFAGLGFFGCMDISVWYNALMKSRSAKASSVRNYLAVFEPAEDGGYVVHFPGLPGCHTQGETFEEAKEHASDAVELYLLAMRGLGEELPAPTYQSIVVNISADLSR